MQVVDKIGLPPGVCFVCEMAPTDGQTVVDTQREFEPGGPTYLNGRKYVCDSCSHTVAKLYGYWSPSEVESTKVDNEWLTARVSELEDRAKQVGEALLASGPVDPKVREAGTKPKPAAKAKKDESPA